MTYVTDCPCQVVSLNNPSDVLQTIQKLDDNKRVQLKQSLQKIDQQKLKTQMELVFKQELPIAQFSPINKYTEISHNTRKSGEEALRQGKVAAVILAGGLGSRFGQEKPKGTFPISCIKNKSLFQLMAERVISAGKKWGVRPKLAIMTSSMTHNDTISFFKDNNFFGLNESDIDFFIQGELPQLDEKGNLILAKDGSVLSAPDGNGAMFWHLVESNTYKKWKACGIEVVSCVQIDNPLVDPFSPELIGFHKEQMNEATIVTIPRENPQEKIGVLVQRGPHLAVVEYSEIPEQDKTARRQDGTLIHPLGSISYFTFSLSFIERLASHSCTLPMHKAKKNTTPNQNKELGIEKPLSLWKFEYFIFDVLAYTDKCTTLVIPRMDCFAPLKNAKGDDSPETVKEALLSRDRRNFKNITSQDPNPEKIFELSSDFLYPTETLVQNWKGKKLPNQEYIE